MTAVALAVLRHIWKPLAILLVLAGVWWHGHGAGRRAVLADWNAEKLATAKAQAEQRAEDTRMAQRASTQHQAEAAAIQARAVALQGKLHDALNQPLPACPATLGAVVVPAAALDSLRAAGADPAP